jgi:hypothetical protein
MTAPSHAVSLEEQIDQWRSYLRRRQAIHAVDVAELEDHLREQVAVLVDAGLATDCAFSKFWRTFSLNFVAPGALR